ncbi:MAG TPA: hypothetical protein VFA68_10785 [Terriglobales bacterium]|nr:hypothetical protein [Terriglobales bacterium]
MANIEWFSPEGKSSKGMSCSADRRWSGEKRTFIFAGALIVAGLLALGCSRSNKSQVSENNNQGSTSASVMPAVQDPAPASAVPVPTPKKKAVRKRSSIVKYSDPVYGVSFKYPRKYSLKTGEEATKDWNGFGPVPTNFVQPGSVTIASVELPSTLYPGTDYTSAIFNVSVNRNLSAAECGQFALADKTDPDPVKPAKVTLSRTEYDEMEAVGLHGMKQADAKYYHVYQNDACYEFALGLGTEGEGTGTVDQVDREQVFRKLETILATVEIKPQPATQVAATGSTPTQSQQP